MDMFGHDDVAYDQGAMPLADLLDDFEEQVVVVWAARQRSALVTTRGDEVGVSGAIVAVEIAGHSELVAWDARLSCDE
jgi:hypothetical protein